MKAIIAHNKLGFIGKDGGLPWKSKEDLQHFKNLTMGQKLLVGFNTAKNLPPLKGREIIVDDRSEINDLDSIDWCIGGKKTYEKYCHLFTELHVSIIDNQSFGDTVYPNLRNLNPECEIFYYHYSDNSQEDKSKRDKEIADFDSSIAFFKENYLDETEDKKLK